MDLLEIRKLLKTRSIYDLPLRVTFYARVSSEKDAQLNSLDNQVAYYTEYIKKKASWTFVPGYVDEGITGMMTTKREQFHQMVEDAKRGQFDLLITKEISRFARNTLDSIHYTRELLSHGVGVFFENDGINTLDEDAELRLTIMSAIAQDEVRKLSSRVKFGHQQAIKKSVVLGNGKIYGYTQERGKLSIDPEQARMVRMLYEHYATGAYSLKQMEDILADAGHFNQSGKPISHVTLSKIITNPKYKGYYVGNKVRVVDMFTKKQKFLDQSEWVMHKDETGEIVPAIVSEELWDRANEIHARRSEDVKKRLNICTHGNMLTGKMYCALCGAPYYRKDSVDPHGKRNSRWVCSTKLKDGTKACPSFALFETEVMPILYEVFTESATDIDKLLTQYMEYYRQIVRGINTGAEKAEFVARAERIKLKKKKLLEFNIDGKITDTDYVEQNSDLSRELTEIEASMYELEKRQKSNTDMESKFKAMRAVFEDAKKAAVSGSITQEFVAQYIDRIDVTPTEEGVELDVKLATTQNVKKVVEYSIRTGTLFKKMIEAQERQMSGK